MYGATINGYKQYYENYLKNTHNNPWLVGLWGVDPGRFETQILCTQIGTPIEGTNRFEDLETGEIWGPARWPRNANSTPEPFDPPLTYNIGARVKGIGTTWWDWKNKHTVRLGFDIDAVIGHSQGVDEATLSKFIKLDLPFLTIIRSTRGLGLHIYLEFGDPFPVTENHNEHAAIARSMLPVLTRLARKQGLALDFEADKDVCGSVMWIHHVNATAENRGYEMIRQATDLLTADHVPANWRDHLPVVSGSRSRVLVKGYSTNGPTAGDELDEMSNKIAKVPLDEVHERILDALEDTGFSVMWVADHHLCQTHTVALAQVHEKLNLRGVFATTAPGDDPGKPNSFLRPLLNGGWDVFRFGEGTPEHESWDKVGEWTHTVYNVNPTFTKVMQISGGTEHVKAGQGYSYSDVNAFETALKNLGVQLKLPARAGDSRALSIKQRGDGKIIVNIEKRREDKPLDFNGFVKTPQGWAKILDPGIKLEEKSILEELSSDLDHQVRALKQRNETAGDSTGGSFIGWVFCDSTGGWVQAPDPAITNVIKQHGYADVDLLKGKALYNSWLLVNEPFKPEFPGGRKWNRDAAQLRYGPAELEIDELPSHPWWDRYLNHLGSDLDIYIKDLHWTEEWNIRTGGDYLKVWLACMIRWPYSKLPYLFMWGSQESGKSMFHESARILMTKGVISADKALTSEGGYNGELYNAVLAYIDETNVSDAGSRTYNRLKAWTTGLTISIHAKYQQPFEAENTCHFVQLANELGACPVLRGDKRITAIQIPPIVDPVPKDIFMNHLEEEASHFIWTLLNWDIPDAPSRLRLPVIETSTKSSAIAMNESSILDYVSDNCFEIPGARIKFDDFYARYISSLSESEADQWPKRRVKKELIDCFLIGRGPGNVDFIGNLTFNPDLQPTEPYTIVGNRLRKDDEDEE